HRQRAILNQHLSVAADQLAAGLALPIWNFDRPQIEKIIESAMQDQAVYGIVIRLNDLKGTVHARVRDENWKLQPIDHDFPVGKLLVQERKIAASNEIIGQMRLVATPRFMEQDLRRTLATSAGTILALDLILTLSLYLLLWHRVLRPLKNLE